MYVPPRSNKSNTSNQMKKKLKLIKKNFLSQLIKNKNKKKIKKIMSSIKTKYRTVMKVTSNIL